MFSYSEKAQTETPADLLTVEDVLKLNLSDLPDWFLEARCCYCKAAGLGWFLRRCGDQRLDRFLARLTCSECGGRPTYVHIQDAPYYHPEVAGKQLLVLIGGEEGAASDPEIPPRAQGSTP